MNWYKVEHYYNILAQCIIILGSSAFKRSLNVDISELIRNMQFIITIMIMTIIMIIITRYCY